MRRTQEGYSPFKDDKPKDAENSLFEASSVLFAKANYNTHHFLLLIKSYNTFIYFYDNNRFTYRNQAISLISEYIYYFIPYSLL